MKIITILFCFILFFCPYAYNATELDKKAQDTSKLEQTGPDNLCVTDNDCWCKIFDGSKFIQGRQAVAGLCCNEENLGKTMPCSLPNSKAGHCGVCLYF